MMEAAARTRMLQTISNGMVAIHREHYGRGSNSVRTIMQGDYVCSFLTDIYNPAERTLIDAGHFDQVQVTRQLFQATVREAFEQVVEEATARKVIAFFSQTHANPDMALEGFVLAPEANLGHLPGRVIPIPRRRIASSRVGAHGRSWSRPETSSALWTIEAVPT